MKEERLFQVIGMIEDNLIREAEEETIVSKPSFFRTASWKWAAAAAGVLLLLGVNVFYYNQNKNYNGMTSFYESNSMATTAAGMVQSAQGKQEEVIEEKEDVLETQEFADNAGLDGNTAGVSSANLEEGLKVKYDWQKDMVSFYTEVIEEIYQPYQGEPLYLNLASLSYLDKEQKEALLEELNGQITVVTGTWEELCKQGIVQEEAEEIVGIYMTFQIITEEEKGFVFQIDCQKGKNIRFGWQECYAWYREDGWSYQLGAK